MDQQERQHFEQALARKRAEAQARERTGGAASPGAPGGGAIRPDVERELIAHERPQDVADPRTKNSRHGQVTADKWNQ